MERNPHALDESHSFLDINNFTIFPNNNFNKDSNSNLASNHQKCKIQSNVTLKQISQKLLDENIDENIDVFPEEAAIISMEKSFYDIIGEKYPPSPNNNPSFSNLSQQNPSISDKYFLQNESLPIEDFWKGREEGMKFLPSINNNRSLIHLTGNTRKGGGLIGSKLQDKDEELDYVRSKGKRHANSDKLSPFEGPKYKISVLYFKDPAKGEIFNKVLLLHGDNYAKEVTRLRDIMERGREFSSNYEENNKDSVDLRRLLIHCSQAMAINDHKTTNELLKQIKNHSSPDGNGVQRLANIFAIGLEARLTGTVDKVLNQIVSRRENAIDMLSAYHIVQISSPFVTATNYFAHFTILNAVQEATKLHIIHLGIEFGYQWPGLMQALSEREVRSPKLRITGIDVPELGCRQMEQIEEIGPRLEAYARSFCIPFEYRAIGTKLDQIRLEDLNIEKDELVIVVSLYRLENLGKETDMMNSSKNQVLNIIRRINPHIFIQAIINASFEGALFAPRFKQVLHHYSALFDLFDTNVPRNNKLRKFVESCLWASEAINAIACEGPKRVERPETYKQWNMRNLRAGFEQVLLDRTVVKKIKEIGNSHNRSFFVDNNNEWLLLGWKGRTISAISTWRPKRT